MEIVRPQISVLMPVYNEVGNIATIIERVKEALPTIQKEIIIVDDGSRDGTRDWLAANFTPIFDDEVQGRAVIAKTSLSENCGVSVVLHRANKGKGGALQTALRAATGDVLVIQDADLEYDPEDWTEMYGLIATKGVADVVYGSRFGGKPHRSLYFHHYFANRLISSIFNLFCNQTLTDIETCYKMFTREVLATLNITANDFGFEVQISSQIALARRWRIYETSIHYYGRTYDEGKKINWKDGLKALWYLALFRVKPGN